MMTRGRGHEALRRGRWSCSGVDYFITCCTEARQRGLEQEGTATALIGALSDLEAEHAWRVCTGTIMPDHVHLLVSLGTDRTLPDVLRLFKGRTSVALRPIGIRWQRGFFDHRMRQGEDRLPVFRYIFLNPYRAGLLTADQRWPGYFYAQEDWAWFKELTNDEAPFPEWLQ